MKIMTGIDLHSNNALCGLMDENGQRLVHKKLPCDLASILQLLLVPQRTSLILSFKSLNERTLGQSVALSRVKAMKAEEARALFTDPADQLVSGMEIELISQLNQAINKIEAHVLSVAGRWST